LAGGKPVSPTASTSRPDTAEWSIRRRIPSKQEHRRAEIRKTNSGVVALRILHKAKPTTRLLSMIAGRSEANNNPRGTALFNETAIFRERLWSACNEIVTFGVELAGIVDD